LEPVRESSVVKNQSHTTLTTHRWRQIQQHHINLSTPHHHNTTSSPQITTTTSSQHQQPTTISARPTTTTTTLRSALKHHNRQKTPTASSGQKHHHHCWLPHHRQIHRWREPPRSKTDHHGGYQSCTKPTQKPSDQDCKNYITVIVGRKTTDSRHTNNIERKTTKKNFRIRAGTLPHRGRVIGNWKARWCGGPDTIHCITHRYSTSWRVFWERVNGRPLELYYWNKFHLGDIIGS
jgi:hypothetical protein